MSYRPEDLSEATIAALAAGRIPPAAEQRLAENAARQGTPSHIFTSNLSTSELLLTAECGFEPLGQVMGCCVYQIGWRSLGTSWAFYTSGEVANLTQAVYEARSLCFSRLQQEAQILRADGVVGVRLDRVGVDATYGTMEFKAVGTAVRAKGGPPKAAGLPFLSNLNGQDHWALRKAGYRPVGFVFGNCSWLQFASWQQYNASLNWSNVEMWDYTQGIYTAREIAMERLAAEAKRVGGVGVVGMDVESRFEVIEMQTSSSGYMTGGVQTYTPILVQFLAYGTAIALDPEGPRSTETLPIMPVGGGAPK